MKKLFYKLMSLFGVLGVVAWLLQGSHRTQVMKARDYYKRTNDLNKTIKMYPNVTLEDIKGQ